MTVNTTVSKAEYAGDGSTTAFATIFRFLHEDDLKVTTQQTVDGEITETLQALTTDYSVTGADNASGGTVTFTTAPASGVTVVIKNSPPRTQETDLTENDPLPAEVLEKIGDKLTIIVQDIEEVLEGKALRLPDTSPSTVSGIFPSPVGNGGKYPRLKTDETGFEYADGADLSTVSIDGQDINMEDKTLNRGRLEDYSIKVRRHTNASGAVTANYNEGNVHIFEMVGDITGVTIGGWPDYGSESNAGFMTLIFEQDGTGGRTVAFGSFSPTIDWGSGGTPTITATAAGNVTHVDIRFVKKSDGGKLYHGSKTWQSA